MDISFGNGNSILKLLRGVFHSQIEFGVGISDKKQIRFILNKNENGIPVHFKFFRVQGKRTRIKFLLSFSKVCLAFLGQYCKIQPNHSVLVGSVVHHVK